MSRVAYRALAPFPALLAMLVISVIVLAFLMAVDITLRSTEAPLIAWKSGANLTLLAHEYRVSGTIGSGSVIVFANGTFAVYVNGTANYTGTDGAITFYGLDPGKTAIIMPDGTVYIAGSSTFKIPYTSPPAPMVIRVIFFPYMFGSQILLTPYQVNVSEPQTASGRAVYMFTVEPGTCYSIDPLSDPVYSNMTYSAPFVGCNTGDTPITLELSAASYSVYAAPPDVLETKNYVEQGLSYAAILVAAIMVVIAVALIIWSPNR